MAIVKNPLPYDPNRVPIGNIKHGDVWEVYIRREAPRGEPHWEETFLRESRYLVLVVVKMPDWPQGLFPFYRSHTRLGDLERYTYDGVMDTMKDLRYRKPNIKWFSHDLTKDGKRKNLYWERKITCLY